MEAKPAPNPVWQALKYSSLIVGLLLVILAAVQLCPLIIWVGTFVYASQQVEQPQFTELQLAAQPEAAFVAPASTRLGTYKVNAFRPAPRSSGSPARVEYIYGTDTPATEVEAFIRRELEQRGWTQYFGRHVNYEGLVTEHGWNGGNGSFVQWRKEKLTYQLSFLRSDAPYVAGKGGQYATYYVLTLSEVFPP
jgi:hypothetical protein